MSLLDAADIAVCSVFRRLKTYLLRFGKHLRVDLAREQWWFHRAVVGRQKQQIFFAKYLYQNICPQGMDSKHVELDTPQEMDTVKLHRIWRDNVWNHTFANPWLPHVSRMFQPSGGPNTKPLTFSFFKLFCIAVCHLQSQLPLRTHVFFLPLGRHTWRGSLRAHRSSGKCPSSSSLTSEVKTSSCPTGLGP